MELYLMRHGIATEWGEGGVLRDADRPLTEEGETKTREAARGMKTMGIRPDLVLSSPYVRAARTADIVADVVGYPIAEIRRTEALLPGAGVEAIFRILAESRAGRTLLVGHAPNLDDVIAYALHADLHVTALKKASLACLELHSIAPPNAVLMHLIPPKTLRALGGKSGS